jgi:ribonuclease G
MQNEIIINADHGETRVAVLERSTFSELHIERAQERSVEGSVVKGRVTRVLPGMQAAFVDIGLEKAAFLYAGDYFANGFMAESGDNVPTKPPNRGRRGSRQPPKIDTLLKEDQEIVVQIAKQPIGSKGARIISHISIPGRHLVLTPWSRRVGVSRRIESDRERKRLREVVERLRPKDLGFIIRTAGDGVREADLEADIRYLASVWENIQSRNAETRAPAVLHSEPDLPLRMIRDFANGETKRIVVDAEASHQMIESFVDRYVADPRPRIERYQGQEPIFDAFGLEAQIDANLGRKVFLKSGGSLVIDQSEALTAIDVNTGRYVGKRDLEETVFKTNLEAVKEVVHQLRFRNIGGLIIIDLIDMESADHRDKTYRALREALRVDKARTNILKISELGLVEMTRKRTRENLVQMLCEPCAYCEGKGYVLSSKSVSFRVAREIRSDLPRFCGRRIALTVAPSVAEELLRDSASLLAELGEELGREVEVRARPGLHQEQFEVVALDEGEPVSIALRWLEDPKERKEERKDGRKEGREEGRPDEDESSTDQENGEGRGGRSRRRRRGGRRRGGSGGDRESQEAREEASQDAGEAAAEESGEELEASADRADDRSPEGDAEPDRSEAADPEPLSTEAAEPEAVDAEEESRILPPSSEDLADPGDLGEPLELAPPIETVSETETESEDAESDDKDDVPADDFADNGAESGEDDSSDSAEDGTEDSEEKER